MPRWTTLNSPGLATSERADLEIELVTATMSAFRKFLVKVENDAVGALDSPVLLAGGIPNPFNLGAVLGHWSKVVSSIKRTVQERLHLTPDDPYLTAMERRLLYSPLPTNAYQSAATVLAMSKSEGWSKASTLRSMAMALNPATGTVTKVVDGLGNEGLPWDVAAKRTARSEATSAYNQVALRALAKDPNTKDKKWVSHHDSLVRSTHSRADGQVVPINATFSVGDYAMMYPGDNNAPYRETMNCRCVIVAGNAKMGDEGAITLPGSMSSQEYEAKFGVDHMMVKANGQEARAAIIDSHHTDYSDQFSAAEQAATNQYASGLSFFDVRDAFKSGKPYLMQDGTDLFTHLDSALAKSVVTTDTKLYRTMRVGKDWLANLQVGSVLEHDFYVSTSNVLKEARAYGAGPAAGRKKVVMEILTPKGTHMIPGYGGTEWILPRGTRLSVRRIEDLTDKTLLIVEVVK